MKLTTHLQLVLRLRMRGAVLMDRSSVTFTFTFVLLKGCLSALQSVEVLQTEETVCMVLLVTLLCCWTCENLWYVTFSQQSCGRFKYFGMWCCLFQEAIADVLKTLPSFRMLLATFQMMQCYIPKTSIFAMWYNVVSARWMCSVSVAVTHIIAKCHNWYVPLSDVKAWVVLISCKPQENIIECSNTCTVTALGVQITSSVEQCAS
jgi:hypothetical protein